MRKITPNDGSSLAGVPTEELKAAVLDAVYNLDGIKVLSGFQFLAAQHKKTNVGIFVVTGTFGRDHYKQAISEAKAAGLNANRVYVYGQTATYSGNAICFCKFAEIGVEVEPTQAQALA
jgi:phosphoserine phosphatase